MNFIYKIRAAASLLSRPSTCSLAAEEAGQSLVELALLLSIFVLLLAGSVDLGQACYAAIEVSAAASAGAQYGTQYPTDVAGMQQAALLNGPNLNNLASSATWGCECSDGSASSVSCTVNPTCSVTTVNFVNVTTSMTYKPALAIAGIPSSIVLNGNSRLRTAH